MYINCHSCYSLRYGIVSEESLIELSRVNSLQYVGLTDINSTSALLNFLRLCKKVDDLKPIVGLDVRNGNVQEYVLIAKSNEGLCEINKFLSERVERKMNFEEEINFSCEVIIIYPFEKILRMEKIDFKTNEYIGIGFKDIIKLKYSVYKNFNDRLVFQQSVTFRNQSDYNVHRLLRAIDLNILLSQLPEREQGLKSDKMLDIKSTRERFFELEFILDNTDSLMEQCHYNFCFEDFRTNQNQSVYTESKEDDFEYLKTLCYSKVRERYVNPSEEVYNRIKKELQAIKQMDFVSYFLINYDIITYAKSKDYPFIGRGSGANSIVAYIVGITNVDPVKLDLYFERFINVYRNSPPDFDMDFSWKDRDDITAYIFNKFENTALMGTYVTFQYRAVVRELAKVFGLSKIEVDNYLTGKKSSSTSDHYFKLVEKYSVLIHGLPNYLSVHSGGILILDKDVHNYTATFLPPKNFRTVMIDMNIAEEVGIYKFDILAQRGLSKIKDTIEILMYNQPNLEVPDLEFIEPLINDDNINELLEVGDCIGVFYVESPAMRTLMTKLKTNSYLGLVAASSIIRPGVTNGGMKNEYILRHRNPERRKQANPILLEILNETHGVMVYQEDVLKVAHLFAGLDLSEADVLRRGMRGKVKSKGQFEKIEQKFKDNCISKGYTREVTLEVWNQVKAFAGYAFAKGHSASYAVESYQSLYLKKYFPLEFMTAVLNNGGGFYNIETYIHEIKMCGGVVVAPCVNNSDHPNKIYGKTVYLGLGMIQYIEMRTVEKILSNRQLYGKFCSFDNFIDRVNIGFEQIIILIRIGAFRFTTNAKHQLLWKVHLIFSKRNNKTNGLQLFEKERINYKLPILKENYIIDAYDEIELLGFPLCSYFDLLMERPSSTILRKDLSDYINKNVIIYGKLVTAKGTPTADKRLMHFGTFLDMEGKIFDTVHFPLVSQRFSIKTNGVYKISGKVVEELDYICIIVESIYLQNLIVDPRYATDHQENKKILVE